MRDLSYQDALNDPELPFRQFVRACVELWNRASLRYEQAGSPYGPASEGDNVTRWMMYRIEVAEHIQAAEEMLGLDECAN